MERPPTHSVRDGIPAPGLRQTAAGGESLPSAGRWLPTADSRQPTADSRQPTADSRQPTADSLQMARARARAGRVAPLSQSGPGLSVQGLPVRDPDPSVVRHVQEATAS
ncbi:hypothetical protein EST54_08555 [Streptomyces sioyaensis]|uniref:Uncharacterized protein n=1 Tax=Streptomyces sioyaensis TaxID=67364 RepID=A0A4Q1R5T0_9ACTN|nr:hypothetical protein EST54_08555 [Streptomyces sioyaensis]